MAGKDVLWDLPTVQRHDRGGGGGILTISGGGLDVGWGGRWIDIYLEHAWRRVWKLIFVSFKLTAYVHLSNLSIVHAEHTKKKGRKEKKNHRVLTPPFRTTPPHLINNKVHS